MSELIKIKDLSSRYDITSRTLRYYEDMGLIVGTRNDENNYRLYDEVAIQRLEQILILRKLNINIKDIQRIFNTTGSEVVLEVLNKKIDNIDDEVALLHELKDIVLDFIHEINRVDFADSSNVKLLYDKAKKIETQFASVDYIGKPSNITRLTEITDKLDKKIPDIMVVRIPKLKVVTSGKGGFDVVFGPMGWEEEPKNRKFAKDVIFDVTHFLIRHADGKFEFVVSVNDDITAADAAPYEITDFAGGLYGMSTSIDSDNESIMKVEEKIINWTKNTNFEYDPTRGIMGFMAHNDDEIQRGLGYAQLIRFVPIKLK